MLIAAGTEITAFHVVGAILAIWAVVLSALGIMRHDFPPKGLEKVVIAISAILVVGTVGSAIATSGEEGPKGHEQENFRNKSGKEGSPAPDEGGTAAPQTGNESGQEPAGETGQQKPGGGAVQTLTISAVPDGQPRFDKGELTAKPGTVRIVMENPSPVPHNVTIEGPGGLNEGGKTVPKGGSSQASAKVKPGKYTYYCSVPGHRDAGMEGELTVAK